MHLIKPAGRKLKWDIRLRIHDGRIVKIAGDRDRNATIRLGHKIEQLVKAKMNGDPPPGELAAWINNMSGRMADRLVSLGLLTAVRLERSKPLGDQIDEWERV